MAQPLHGDCLVCLAKNERKIAPEEQVLALLHMMANGCTYESIRRDLCFAHRRQHEWMLKQK